MSALDEIRKAEQSGAMRRHWYSVRLLEIVADCFNCAGTGTEYVETSAGPGTRCVECGGSGRMVYDATDDDDDLIVALRNRAPELLNLWEAAKALHELHHFYLDMPNITTEDWDAVVATWKRMREALSALESPVERPADDRS